MTFEIQPRCREEDSVQFFYPSSTMKLIVILLCVLCGSSIAAEPVVGGLAGAELSQDMKGQVLVEEMNCVACHAAEGSLAARSRKAPRLAEIGARVHPAWLAQFLANPHGTKPGTTMPDAMGYLPAEEKSRAAEALTHFLMSQKPASFAPEAPDLVAAREGHRLFQARGCAACHAPREERAAELPMTGSVPLGELHGKYSRRSLTEFLLRPHAVRPSGRMADMRLADREAEQLAHFLTQRTRVPGGLRYTRYRGQVWEGMESENVTPERSGQVVDFDPAHFGKLPQHTALVYEGWLTVEMAGTYKFFLTLNGGSLEIGGKTLMKETPSDRRGVKSLEAVVELDAAPQPLRFTYFHTGREAKMKLEVEGPGLPRGPIPADMLSVEKEPVAPFQPLVVDAALAARGREHFARLGCANCHDDAKVPGIAATAFAKLDATRGCLGEDAGAWPQFGFSTEQRALISKSLPTAPQPQLDDAQRIHKTLAAMNCIACHDRKGLGGPTAERRALFTGTQPSLGDQGRVPPPLTGVGAKLTPQWLAAVMLHGQRQRDYVDAAMPQYGEAQVGHLAELFGKVDVLEKAALPKVEQLVESKAAGYELVGATGLGCIACHAFNGQKSGEISAVDIARTPERVQRNWFDLYMRQPSRFHPTVIMPGYWPDGKSVRPNILAGDSALQIEAIWNYLSDGERAKKPAGLSRQSNELRVGDVAEICRGRSPATGYRGIGVGYPERVNLAFDAGEMALRQLWRGEFASADFGSFHPRGTDTISLPPGIPFHRMKTADENWPSKGKTNHAFPQDLGYEFRGYSLDAKRRPTFRYNYGDIAVEDFFEDVRGEDGRGFFRRTLRFTAPAAQEMFQFRAAAGKGVSKISGKEFHLEKLRLRIVTDNPATMRDGTPAEVLIPLTLPQGETRIVLEYGWVTLGQKN